MPEPTVPILDAEVDPDRADPVDALFAAAERAGVTPEAIAAAVMTILRRLAADGRIAQGVVSGVASEFAVALRWRPA